MPQINNAGLELIENFEGCRLVAYQDVGDVWTIGYGHTGNVKPGQTITQAQADALLEADLQRFEKIVNDAVAVDLTANQFAACVSLCYNIGPGDPAEGIDGFLTSTVLRDINARDFDAAQAAFALWNKVNGEVIDGLVRRRAAEAALFGTP